MEATIFTQAGIRMFEFRVNDHKALWKITDIKHPQLRGNVNVRAWARSNI
jgi:hypothetical protein